jgi:hypothetical protein
MSDEVEELVDAANALVCEYAEKRRVTQASVMRLGAAVTMVEQQLPQETAPPPKRSWWQRLFGKRDEKHD